MYVQRCRENATSLGGLPGTQVSPGSVVMLLVVIISSEASQQSGDSHSPFLCVMIYSSHCQSRQLGSLISQNTCFSTYFMCDPRTLPRLYFSICEVRGEVNTTEGLRWVLCREVHSKEGPRKVA